MTPFTFSLGQRLAIICSSETGECIARAEYLKTEPSYLLRYRAADGQAVEAWWPQTALGAASFAAQPGCDAAISVQRIDGTVESYASTPAPTGTNPLTPPPIGHLWAAQGGWYAGIARGIDGAPDHHLILAQAKPTSDLAWQPALDWARHLHHRGHADWSLPTRAESALLFANLKPEFESSWHWTSEPYEGSGSYAWYQYFLGGQSYGSKSYEGRARAVRRLILQSLSA